VTEDRRASWRAGVRAGLPYAAASSLVALSFGVYAHDVGMPPASAIVMSAVVHAGSAQFAAVSIVASGGGLATATLAAVLMNSRFLPMGIAIARSFPGGPVKRAVQAQGIVDPSWVIAAKGGGWYDRWILFGATAVMYVAWQIGTVVGALGGGHLGDPDKLGLDAIFPTFFLALLFNELRDRTAVEIAIAGALVAILLVTLTPPGVPVLAASAMAFLALRRRRAAA
jgi:4-azaleucine resistance transporter AzlC